MSNQNRNAYENARFILGYAQGTFVGLGVSFFASSILAILTLNVKYLWLALFFEMMTVPVWLIIADTKKIINNILSTVSRPESIFRSSQPE